jgi:hypothetical protein
MISSENKGNEPIDLNFEDLNHLKELFNFSIIEDEDRTMNSFLSNLCFLKLNEKINKITYNGMPQENLVHYSKSIRALICLNSFKNIVILKDENKLSQMDILEVIHKVYKIMKDENNEIKSKDLDLLIIFILSDCLVSCNSFEKFSNILENFENKKTSVPNIGFCNNKISYETLEKNIKILIFFTINKSKFQFLFDTLDSEQKSKILTAELVVFMNKLQRNLSENEQFSYYCKRYIEFIDSTQVYIKKNDYYLLALKSIL